MTAFDNSEFEKRKTEAKSRWGGTDAYKAFEAKTENYTAQDWDTASAETDQILEAFAVCMKNGNTAASAEAQTLVQRLQACITEHYYTCTPQILAGLGQMYVCDERFAQNIDKHGAGTAAFICEAIEIFCGKNS